MVQSLQTGDIIHAVRVSTCLLDKQCMRLYILCIYIYLYIVFFDVYLNIHISDVCMNSVKRICQNYTHIYSFINIIIIFIFVIIVIIIIIII